MLETPHVVVAAAIATHVVHPGLALPIALASHFLLEKVPHWNPHLGTEIRTFGYITNRTTILVTLDSLTALCLGSYLSLRVLPNTTLFMTVLLSCFLACLPDIVEAPYYFLNKKSQLIEKWIKFQKSLQVDTTPFWGILTQVIVIGAALWWTLG